MTDKTYDLIIIGGGPGGLTAAIYALRAKLDLLLIEKTGIGGQIALSDVVENYPGVAPMSGMELMGKFEEQAKSFGLNVEYTEVQAVRDGGDHRVVSTSAGELRAKAVIIASGAKPRRLDVPGEAEFTGRGVSYCATCDGFFFKGKAVAVVGGGDTAAKEALFLAKMVDKIDLVHRRDSLRAEKIIQEKTLNDPKIAFHWDSVVTKVTGDKTVSGVTIKNVKTDALTELPVAGVFVFVGILPNSEFIDCDKDQAGFIKTDEHMRTSIPGVFAVGDVRTTVLRQVATSVGDGAIAAYAAGEFLAGL